MRFINACLQFLAACYTLKRSCNCLKSTDNKSVVHTQSIINIRPSLYIFINFNIAGYWAGDMIYIKAAVSSSHEA